MTLAIKAFLVLAGFAAVMVGLYMWWPPLALIVGGVLVMGAAGSYRERPSDG